MWRAISKREDGKLADSGGGGVPTLYGFIHNRTDVRHKIIPLVRLGHTLCALQFLCHLVECGPPLEHSTVSDVQ